MRLGNDTWNHVNRPPECHNRNTLEELRCLRLRHTLLSNSSSGEEGCSKGPRLGEKTWGSFYLRSVAFEAMNLRRRHIKDFTGATRRRALAAGLMGERLLHASCILWGKGSAEAKSLLVSTLSQP